MFCWYIRALCILFIFEKWKIGPCGSLVLCIHHWRYWCSCILPTQAEAVEKAQLSLRYLNVLPGLRLWKTKCRIPDCTVLVVFNLERIWPANGMQKSASPAMGLLKCWKIEHLSVHISFPGSERVLTCSFLQSSNLKSSKPKAIVFLTQQFPSDKQVCLTSISAFQILYCLVKHFFFNLHRFLWTCLTFWFLRQDTWLKERNAMSQTPSV